MPWFAIEQVLMQPEHSSNNDQQLQFITVGIERVVMILWKAAADVARFRSHVWWLAGSTGDWPCRGDRV
jgi:hypothetical protein